MLCPLGSGFSTTPADHVLLIGGGVGNAPLYLLACALKTQGCRVSMIYGARSADYVYLEEKFRSVCDHFVLCTDDGSCGEKGLVTCFIDSISPAISRAAICGPLPMMRATSDILAAKGTPPKFHSKIISAAASGFVPDAACA